jgi:hypothetical protein
MFDTAIDLPTSTGKGPRQMLEDVAAFFSLPPNGEKMATLCRTSPSTLNRILTAKSDDIRMREEDHLAVLAAFVDALTKLYERAANGREVDKLAVRTWLNAGRVMTSRGPMVPIRALSDPDLAIEALDEVRRDLYMPTQRAAAAASPTQPTSASGSKRGGARHAN